MTEGATTTFDIQALGRAFEAGDADRVLAFYADDHEHIEIDADAPPSAPRTRVGAEAVEFMRGAVGYMAANGVKIGLENPVVGDDRAACTISVSFPDGRRLLSNTIYDLKDGKVVRQLDIQVTDPENA
jgi:hypothetical protein